MGSDSDTHSPLTCLARVSNSTARDRATTPTPPKLTLPSLPKVVFQLLGSQGGLHGHVVVLQVKRSVDGQHVDEMRTGVVLWERGDISSNRSQHGYIHIRAENVSHHSTAPCVPDRLSLDIKSKFTAASLHNICSQLFTSLILNMTVSQSVSCTSV